MDTAAISWHASLGLMLLLAAPLQLAMQIWLLLRVCLR
jgi:hypothetical protein